MDFSESSMQDKSQKPRVEGYEWVLDNFRNLNHAAGSFISTPLISTNNPTVKWRIALFPYGRQVSDFVSVYVQLFSDVETILKTSAAVTFFFMTGANEIVYATTNVYTLKFLPESEYNNKLLPAAAGEDKFVSRLFLEQNNGILRKTNCLKLCCQIFFFEPNQLSMLPNPASQTDDRLKVIQNFGTLLDDGKFSDFILDVGDKEIHIHKAIVANCSPIFEAMFVSEMQEKKQNRVEITDVQYSVLKEMLNFIYTGTIDVKNITDDLFVAADKYSITELKTLCAKTFSNYLTVENALNRLIFADKYNCSILKSQVIQFIVDHSSEIIKNTEFIDLRSDLMYEITYALTQKLTFFVC